MLRFHEELDIRSGRDRAELFRNGQAPVNMSHADACTSIHTKENSWEANELLCQPKVVNVTNRYRGPLVRENVADSWAQPLGHIEHLAPESPNGPGLAVDGIHFLTSTRLDEKGGQLSSDDPPRHGFFFAQ